MSRFPSPPPVSQTETNVAETIATTQRALDNIEERRRCPRAPLPVSAALRTLAGGEIPARPADNVSESGLRLTVPVGFGLAVGQRYEVLLRRDGPDGKSRDLVGEGHYATVVRTEILLHGKADDDRVGVGFRFDSPIALQ